MPTPDYALLRDTMVESQVRTSDVTDRRVLRAMRALPRELFVPAEQQPLAYRDEPIALAAGRFLLPAALTARLIQLAVIEPHHAVLEIGTASGYGAAVMASIARRVVALESDAGLAALARKALAAASLPSVELVEGPLMSGWDKSGPYDRIVISGCVADIPLALEQQVVESGRLIGIVGDSRLGKVMVYEKVGSQWSKSLAFTCAAPVLPGFAAPSVFAL